MGEAGSLAPLAGFRVGIAAHRSSQEQVEALRQAGADPVPGAVVGPVPSAGIDMLEAVTEDVLARPPTVVVLTSAGGVEGWFSAAEGIDRGVALRETFAGATLLTQGGETAATASALGLAVAGTLSLQGVGAPTQLARLSGGLSGARVVVQSETGRAEAATADLVSSLIAAGVHMVDVAVPTPAPAEDPRAAVRLVDAVVERRLDALTFTAPAEVRAFVRLAEDVGAWDDVLAALSDDVVVVCLSRTCAEVAASVGISDGFRPPRARVGAMVDVLGERLAARVLRLRLAGVEVVLRGALALVGGEELWLADRERGVLVALARRPGSVVAKAELLRRVWRSDGVDGADEHAVEVAVARLRRRLGPAGAGLQTVPRRGYRLMADRP